MNPPTFPHIHKALIKIKIWNKVMNVKCWLTADHNEGVYYYHLEVRSCLKKPAPSLIRLGSWLTHSHERLNFDLLLYQLECLPIKKKKEISSIERTLCVPELQTEELDRACTKIQVWMLILAISKWGGVRIKTDSGNLEKPCTSGSAQHHKILISLSRSLSQALN